MGNIGHTHRWNDLLRYSGELNMSRWCDGDKRSRSRKRDFGFFGLWDKDGSGSDRHRRRCDMCEGVDVNDRLYRRGDRRCYWSNRHDRRWSGRDRDLWDSHLWY